MKVIAVFFLAFLGILLGAAQNAELAQVQSVYILPMANGFDQYLANRIANTHTVQVVTDPKAADAVFTDRLGPAFEARMDELFPAAKPAEQKKSDDTDERSGASDRKDESTPHYSFSGRGKGTIFLVDAKSRRVLWSAYEQPRNFTPEQLDKTARKAAELLKKDLTGK